VAGDLLLPKCVVVDGRGNATKLRGMILALASYASRAISGEDASTKLLELYHPSLTKTTTTGKTTRDDDDGAVVDNNDGDETKNAIELAELAIRCGKMMASSDGAFHSLLHDVEKHDLVVKFLLIYSCNAFEGGRIYRTLSRVNHDCNPNAIVVERGGRGGWGWENVVGGDDHHANIDDANRNAAKNDNIDDHDVSVLRAACDISPGDEITISYLGRYLYASYPIRQRLLRMNKHFMCRCSRCEGAVAVDVDGGIGGGDLASRVPCPVCHPRTGRYLDDDVMFDDDDDDIDVRYAVPSNGLIAGGRSLHCPTCRVTTTVDACGSMKRKKEGTAVKYMCMAEDKVFDRLCGDVKSKRATGRGGDDDDDDAETEQDIDRQFLQMATSVCGSMHWTTHFLNLSLIEDALASFHSTLLTMGRDASDDRGGGGEAVEELLVEIAEAADGIERAFKFASSLGLKLDPAHWLFDYAVGMARALVGLGDVKSQKYGSRWITRVEKYAEKFENDGMNKVVVALRDAWKRETDDTDDVEVENSSSSEHCGIQDARDDTKRRKIE
jgi:hypothetical protein